MLIHSAWCAPKFFDRLKCESKVKIVKGSRIGARSLARNTFEVKGHAWTPRWGVGRMTSNSITHKDLHNPNKKLVSA
jgi:hypothetical protein